MLGRMVHYYQTSRAMPRAALVVSEEIAGHVNLLVYSSKGVSRPEPDVYLHQDGDAPVGAFCSWMPQIHEIPSPEIE